MRITLSGNGGTGKGTVADLLCKKYGLHSYDVGSIKREEGLKRGMSINEFNEWSRLNPQEGDKAFDNAFQKIGETEDDFVAIGRLTWHFIPHAFKILLTVTDAEAGRRIFAQSRSSEIVESADDAEVAVRKRNEADQNRYMDVYGLDYTDESHYDLVIDTTKLTIDEVFEKICVAIPESVKV